MTETQHKLGLVLSGGGARAAAHIGALRALTEHGLKPTVISGASAGALVAALYGCRFSLNEMLEVFETTELFSWNHLGFTKKPGLLDAERLVDVLARLFGGLTFNDSDTELHIVTTDLLSGQPHFFTHGPLDRAVTASSAYPGVISPLDIDGRVYADGGIADNFPIEPLVNKCEIIMGSNVNPLPSVSHEKLNSTVSVSQRAFQIATSRSDENKFQQCHFGLAPHALNKIGLLERERSREAHDIGYRATYEFIDELIAKF